MLNFEYSDKNRGKPVAYISFSAMHTIFEIIMVSIEEKTAQKLSQYIFSYVRSIEKKFNRFDTGSEIARINTMAGSSISGIDDETFMVLELCETMRKATKGYFDITAESALKTRRDLSGGYELDPASRTVFLKNTYIDLGGFAKGYCLDKIKKTIDRNNITNALVNFGNSSILAKGRHPYGNYWPVGIEIPCNGGKSCKDFKLEDNTLSVSGISPSGKRHIINPFSGKYADSGLMTAVTGKSAAITEILSTALFAAPENERREILSNFPGYKAYDFKWETNGNIITNQIQRALKFIS